MEHEQGHEHEHVHISSYKQHAKVLMWLLILTMITLTATWLDFGRFSVAVAMIIASIKVSIVLTYFMHLKFEEKLFRFLVGGVLLLYGLVVVLTFFDYLLR